MFEVSFEGLYGVRMLDTKSMVRIDTAPTKAVLLFRGMPVIINAMCEKHIHNIKRWKRLNRPDKVRVRDFIEPTAYIANPPLVQTTSIICHPKIAEILENN